MTGVVFKNITVTGATFPQSGLFGFDAAHPVQNVLFQNLVIQGRPIENLEAGKIKVNDFVKGVRFTR